ncbi:uncharacterized protein TNCV_1353681 [Trichonephila clavipes]|nr:uncharacterized protein TNCV_1353681 [Trichonephila clavipes]
MLSIWWSTTAELSNRHSSCRAVSSSIIVVAGGKRKGTARSRASQRFSIGLRSGECAGQELRTIPSLSRMMNAAERATSVIDCPASMRPTARQRSEFSIRFLEVIEARMS